MDKDEEIPAEGLDHTRTESDQAVESEEDGNVIHVYPPSHRFDKVGGGGYDPPTEDLGPHGGNTAEEGGWIDERGYGVPILASDEIAKDPSAEFLHPAVSPPLERSGSEFHPGWDADHNSHQERLSRTVSRGSSASVSRANSRAGSMSGGIGPGLSRYLSPDDREEISTKLEDVEEYEPLFPEDEDNKESSPKLLGKSRREVLLRHKFPSEDIWEDAPESTQLHATVSVPALPEEDARTVVPDNDDDRSSIVDVAPSQEKTEDVEHFKPGAYNERGQLDGQADTERKEVGRLRPRMKQRFPSRDIWEDTPASLQLQTVVLTPQIEEVTSPPEQPEVSNADVSTQEDHMAAAGVRTEDGVSSSASSTAAMGEKTDKPIVPARPARTEQLSKGLAGQPIMPPRPSKSIQRSKPSNGASHSAEEASLSESQNFQSPAVSRAGGSDEEGKVIQPSSPITERKVPGLPERPKPQVPARPAKPAREDTGEGGVPLSKSISAASAASTGSVSEEGKPSKSVDIPQAPRSKPAVPARPNGSKIAALKAGFMNDLDKRLQMGPPAPKGPNKVVEESEMQEKDRAPLSDARKGRARGPTRRKPAASPAGVANEASIEKPTAQLEITQVFMAWQISSDGSVDVVSDGSTKLTKNMNAEPTSSTSLNNPGKGVFTAGDAESRATGQTSGDGVSGEQSSKGPDRDTSPGVDHQPVKEDLAPMDNRAAEEISTEAATTRQEPERTSHHTQEEEV